MTKKELNLIADLLEMASDEFSNHVCNDFDLSKYFSKDEIIDWDKQYHIYNGDPEEHDPENVCKYTMDWALMSYYANKIRNLDTVEMKTKYDTSFLVLPAHCNQHIFEGAFFFTVGFSRRMLCASSFT